MAEVTGLRLSFFITGNETVTVNETVIVNEAIINKSLDGSGGRN